MALPCRCRTLAGWKDEKKWLIAAQELNFSAEQRSRIMRARADMLAKLEECGHCLSACLRIVSGSVCMHGNYKMGGLYSISIAILCIFSICSEGHVSPFALSCWDTDTFSNCRIYSERKKLNLAAVQALLGKQPAQSLAMGSGNNSTITSAEREHLMDVRPLLLFGKCNQCKQWRSRKASTAVRSWRAQVVRHVRYLPRWRII